MYSFFSHRGQFSTRNTPGSPSRAGKLTCAGLRPPREVSSPFDHAPQLVDFKHLPEGSNIFVGNFRFVGASKICIGHRGQTSTWNTPGSPGKAGKAPCPGLPPPRKVSAPSDIVPQLADFKYSSWKFQIFLLETPDLWAPPNCV